MHDTHGNELRLPATPTSLPLSGMRSPNPACLPALTVTSQGACT